MTNHLDHLGHKITEIILHSNLVKNGIHKAADFKTASFEEKKRGIVMKRVLGLVNDGGHSVNALQHFQEEQQMTRKATTSDWLR